MIRNNYLSRAFFCAAVLGTMFLVRIGYSLWHEHVALKKTVTYLQQRSEDVSVSKHIDIGSQQIVETPMIKKEVWRAIQEDVNNCVVQVISQVSSIVIDKPYETEERSCCGTAFFIDEEGYLITNAHVVNQAKSVWIQMPQIFGQRIIDVEVVGVSPQDDVALLRLTPESLELIKSRLGSIPYLKMGDSNTVRRSDEVLALGYPLGQRSLKSTTGVISGREGHLIQMSAPLNPGNSGGPLLNAAGLVIGVNTANVPDAQNIGYIIPINDVIKIIPELSTVTLLRKPFLGILYSNSTEALTEYLGNPLPGGCYIVEVIKNSTLYKAGVQRGDMLYEINGYALDMFGDMNVEWSQDRISVADFVSQLTRGQDITIVTYRKGKRKEYSMKFDATELPAIRRVYVGYESFDYEVFAGMVVCPLTINHIQAMINNAPGLAKYADIRNQTDPALLITHIFPNSQLHRSRTIPVGAVLLEVNGMKVSTLEEFRDAIRSSVGSKYLTLRVADNTMRFSDYVFSVLRFDQVLKEEADLSRYYRYPLSDIAKELLQAMSFK